MAAITGKKEEVKDTITINFTIGFDELLAMVQQLPDAKQVEFLDALQAQLEKEKLIKPRTDEDQRKQAQKEERDAVMQRFIDQAPNDGEGEELDANLTDKELLEMIKNI